MAKWIYCIIFAAVFTATFQKSLKTEKETEALEEHVLSLNSSEHVNKRNCTCNWRYLLHYEAKGCIPIEEDICGCPTKFDCPNINEIEANEHVCFYKGKEYSIGSIIDTNNMCRVCRCSRGSKVGISCRPIECAVSPPEPGCYLVYEKDKCCPVDVACGNKEAEDELSMPKASCEYGGQVYPLGARFYPDDDPCLVCTCTDNWYDANSSSCHYQDCILGKNKAKIQQGCIPIYHEKTCCPIEFYCPSDNSFTSENDTINLELNSAGSMCIFDGQFYEVGKVLSLSHMSNCITCTCQTPPDFTCIHQSCPPPPDEDNCYSYYVENSCCPLYDCALGDGALLEDEVSSMNITNSNGLIRREMEDELKAFEQPDGSNPCSGVHCEDETEKCVLYHVICPNATCLPIPTCMKINSSCPEPQCALGCGVIEHNEHNCPQCVCGEEIERSRLKCYMPHCGGQNCHYIASNNGCPVCSCEQPCAIPECQPGCNVLSEVEGQCPVCVCEDETEGCPTPVCEHEGCHIESPPDGCPTCICSNIDDAGIERDESQPQVQVVQQQQTADYNNSFTAENNDRNDEYDTIVIMPKTLSESSQKVVKRDMEETIKLAEFTKPEPNIEESEIENYEDNDQTYENLFNEKLHLKDEYEINEFSKNSEAEKKGCSPVQCNGYDCHIVRKDNCHTCLCKYVCPPPTCGKNCVIQYNGEDSCPSCVCYVPLREEP